MNPELKKNILSIFESVANDLTELETTSNFVHFVTQIAGSDSNLNSFPSLLKNISGNDIDVKTLLGEISKRLSNFMFTFKTRNLSFFYPIPSTETYQEFYNQPIKIIDDILAYGLKNGKIPIPDPNPIYEAFSISYQFTEKTEHFRNCLLLLYRNVILQTLFLPLNEILTQPKSTNINSDEYGFDINKLFEDIYVIESESGMIQGTAFHLRNIGLITCDHCIRDEQTNQIFNDISIFKGNDFAKKFPVEVLKSNRDLDVALLEIPLELKGQMGLELGSSNNLQHLEKISVAGFPNYNFGDNGIFSPGLIVGFRKYSGIRHLLVNCPLISGNSGGPAFNSDSNVIGIAVTGADKMSKAHETEKHGIIPIEAIFDI